MGSQTQVPHEPTNNLETQSHPQPCFDCFSPNAGSEEGQGRVKEEGLDPAPAAAAGARVAQPVTRPQLV